MTMTSIQTTPTFPAGSAVRDTGTGREYVSTGNTARQGDQLDYWTIVHSADGIDRQLPTDELELVEDALTPGTRVLDRASGKTYTVAHLDNPGQSTWVRRDDDGTLDVVRTDDLEAVAL